jgi:hypothetical protein
MSNYNNFLSFTIFSDLQGKTLNEYQWSWEEFCQKVESPRIYPSKAHMPLIKMATFGEIKTSSNSLRNDDNVLEVYGVECDYDGGIITIDQAADALKKRGVRAVLYSTPTSSPEKPKWRVMAPFSKPLEPEERYQFVGLINAVFDGLLDNASFTLSQGFYIGRTDSPYDVRVVDGETIDLKIDQWDPLYPKEKKTIIDLETGEITGNKLDIAALMTNIFTGVSWHDSLRDLAAHYAATGVKRTSAIETLQGTMNAVATRDARWEERFNSIPNLVNTAYQKFGVQEFVAQVVTTEPANTEFIVDKNGKIEKTQANVLKLLSQYQLRYDNFRAAAMITIDGVVRPIEDEDYTRLQFIAEKMGFKPLSRDMIRDNVLMLCANNSYDSAVEWGENLKWDGVPRCERLLVDYFGAEESPYVNAASMYIASAMGGRLIEPGCKADAVIVLVGDQGKGKTVSIQALAPMEETFAEISLHSRDSDLSRLLRGKLIGELAELRGLKSKESEDIKAWISRTTEEWTPKYMEFTKTFKRRLTLWGSTNDRHFLNDVTGNRRWLPISVDNPNPDLIKRDCIQIWAEAIHIFKDYGVLWETVQKLAEDVRAEHFDEDPFVDDVRNYLDANPSMNKVSAREIWVGMGKFGDAFDKRAAGQLKRAMAVLGWTYKKVKTGTKSLQGYVKS